MGGGAIGNGDETGDQIGDVIRRVLRRGRYEIENLDLRLAIGLGATRLLPLLVGGRIRGMMLRLAGIGIGYGSSIGGPVFVAGRLGAGGLRIGRSTFINARCHFDVTSTIEIGDRVSLGQEVMIITGTHDPRDPTCRSGAIVAAPVRVGAGAWLGARCVILPGVTVGEGAIVAAGAVVTTDVPPHTVFAGVPAKLVKALDDHA